MRCVQQDLVFICGPNTVTDYDAVFQWQEPVHGIRVLLYVDLPSCYTLRQQTNVCRVVAAGSRQTDGSLRHQRALKLHDLALRARR